MAGNSRRALGPCDDGGGRRRAVSVASFQLLVARQACGLGCLGSPGQGLVFEPCCPGILMGNYRFLPVMIGQSGMVAGDWRWDAELRGDLSPRHARRKGLGHRPGEEIVGPIAAGGSLAVKVHRKVQPGPLDGRALFDPSP